MTNVLDELSWRGLISQTTDEAALRAALEKGLTLYCGFDPTAPSLHFGNLVQLVVMRHLQRAGMKVICLVGGSTGLIGDPRPSAERVLKTKEQTADWVAQISEQVKPFLQTDGDNPALLVNNLDWTAPLSALDFLRDVGKHFRVNQMIKKDAVAARLNSDEGISYTEFSYQLLQGLDYLQLYRDHGCTLQTGGQDQWGNLVAGVDLIRKVEGAAVHLLTTPLITDSAGNKFGKSEGNAVWLNAELTSPYAFYQYWLNVEDASVVMLLKVFTDRTQAEIAELAEEVATRPAARRAQRTLAHDVTALVHGEEAVEAVERASQALFGRAELRDLPEEVLAQALTELDPVPVTGEGMGVLDLLVATGLAASKGAARRTIGEGAAYVNNVPVSDPDARLSTDDLLHGRWIVTRRGRRTIGAGVVRIDAESSSPATN